MQETTLHLFRSRNLPRTETDSRQCREDRLHVVVGVERGRVQVDNQQQGKGEDEHHGVVQQQHRPLHFDLLKQTQGTVRGSRHRAPCRGLDTGHRAGV